MEQQSFGQNKLNRRNTIIALVVLGIFTALVIGMIVLRSNKSEVVTAPQAGLDYAALYEKYKNYSGTWKGGWNNKTFKTGGNIVVEVSVEQNGIVSALVDMQGKVFGLVDPEPKTFKGYYDDKGAFFEINKDSLFGEVSVALTVDGKVTAKGFQIPISRVDAVTGEGTFNEKRVDMTYAIDFAGKKKSDGVIELVKQ